MIEITATFTCDTCGKKKTNYMKMSYEKYEGIFLSILSETPKKLMLPTKWSYDELKRGCKIECATCTNKWKKEHGFIIA